MFLGLHHCVKTEKEQTHISLGCVNRNALLTSDNYITVTSRCVLTTRHLDTKDVQLVMYLDTLKRTNIKTDTINLSKCQVISTK